MVCKCTPELLPEHMRQAPACDCPGCGTAAASAATLLVLLGLLLENLQQAPACDAAAATAAAVALAC